MNLENHGFDFRIKKIIKFCDSISESTENSDFSAYLESSDKFDLLNKKLILVELESVMIDPLYTETASPDTDHVL